MPTTGTTVTFRTKLTNPDTGLPEDAKGAIKLVLIEPFPNEAGEPIEHTLEGGEVKHDGEEGSGLYHADYRPTITGLWHWEWIVANESVDQGDLEMESKRETVVNLRDLKVLVPRARRKVEGPWGNANGRRPLLDSEVYAMVADACSELKMLSGGWFHHVLKVKARDPLGGFPTEWETDTPLEEYEAAIVCAQLALNYYTLLFRNLKTSESIKNEGTEWTYSISPSLLRSYLDGIKEERDLAIAGLRINIPVLDRFVSNIRVRDQATVAVLEWWDQQSPGLAGGGLPGGQEATSIPWFPGAEGSFA